MIDKYYSVTNDYIESSLNSVFAKDAKNDIKLIYEAFEINNIGLNTIIINKLLELFPGYYGKFISLNFSRYLSCEIETKEQMEAFYQIITFFDNVPDINLLENLQLKQ